jgi:hypothetical protein
MTDWGMMIATCEGRKERKETHRILVSVTLPPLKEQPMGIATKVFTKHTKIIIFTHETKHLLIHYQNSLWRISKL